MCCADMSETSCQGTRTYGEDERRKAKFVPSLTGLAFTFTAYFAAASAELPRLGVEKFADILTSRFSKTEIADWSAIKGIIVPGGDFERRFDEALSISKAHPHLKIAISGIKLFDIWDVYSRASQDVRRRIVLELRATNTYGNAIFTKELIRPAAGERWLLVTSASHMPRAIGTFHKAGFPVEPWPVDDKENVRLHPYIAVHEWIGLVVYRLLGKTGTLLPGQK
jgi:uncharacterized SAM-binding protein YcdF (DUF218 family)